MFIDNNNNKKNKTLFIKLVNNSCKEFTVYGILSSSFFALALPFVKKKREFNYKSLLISYLFSLKCYLFVFFFSSLSLLYWIVAHVNCFHFSFSCVTDLIYACKFLLVFVSI